jgi:hypothetical protein
MKSLEVREQVRPPLRRCVELVVSGVKYRLFRAGITVVIIALAAAFLMTMLTESLITRRVAAAIEAETAPRRQLQFWVGRLSSAPSSETLAGLLAGMEEGGPRWQEYAAWGAGPDGPLSDEQLAQLRDVARRQQVYIDYFEGLRESQRRVLLGRRRGERALAEFIEADSPPQQPALREDSLAVFRDELERLQITFATSVERFEQFLKDWHRTRPVRRRIIAGHREALAQLRQPGGLLHGRPPKDLLAGADEDVRAALRAGGFHMPTDVLATVRRAAAEAVDAERIERCLGSVHLKVTLGKRHGLSGSKVAQVNAAMLFSELESSSGAEWFVKFTDDTRGMDVRGMTVEKIRASAKAALDSSAEVEEQAARLAEQMRQLVQAPYVRDQMARRMKREPADLSAEMMLSKLTERSEAQWLEKELTRVAPLAPLGLSVERVREVARARLDRSGLAETEARVSQAASKAGFLGFSSRTLWLIVVSFLVCVVGIANAMLMSVTERFREIATMKCLGATDGFIMISFVMESCLQGVAGSLIGVVLGFGLGAVRTWAKYGWLAMEHLPGLEVLAAGGVSLVLGILISAMAAVYPAWVAARLAPMEAMRIE